MPPKSIKWDADADAKLFSLIIHFYNIKVGGENLKKLNIAMGLAANSQSLTHRIGFLKKQGSLAMAGTAGDELKPVTPRPGARKTKAPKQGRKDSVVEDDDELGGIVKSEPASEPEHTPFYNGGTKALKRKGSDDDDGDENETTNFTLSLMGKSPAASKKTKVNPIQADEEHSGFKTEANDTCVWDDLNFGV